MFNLEITKINYDNLSNKLKHSNQNPNRTTEIIYLKKKILKSNVAFSAWHLSAKWAGTSDRVGTCRTLLKCRLSTRQIPRQHLFLPTKLKRFIISRLIIILVLKLLLCKYKVNACKEKTESLKRTKLKDSSKNTTAISIRGFQNKL